MPTNKSTLVHRLIKAKVSMPLILTLCLVLGFSPAVLLVSPASAAANQVVVGMPFSGKWAWNASVMQPYPPYVDSCAGGASNCAGLSSHPSVHHTPGLGDWATDIYAAEGTAVKLNVPVTTGALTYSWKTTSTSCGQSTGVNIIVDGTTVGWLYYAHINSAVTSGAITNGMTLGTVHDWVVNNVHCNPGVHVHTEFKNSTNHSCFVDNGSPGVTLSYGANFAVLGSGNASANEPCSGIPGGSGGVTPPSAKMTASTEDAPFGGDFNGDGWGDALVIQKHATDNGANIHALYGGSGANMFNYPGTFVRDLPAPTWDLSKLKFAVGRFNTDAYSDLAVIDQLSDGGANVHIFYGSTGTPLQSYTDQRNMPGPNWNWSQMKVVSGDFNGDGWDDIVIGHKLSPSNGMGLHVLLGAAGTAALNNATTSWRSLYGPAWLWDDMKLAAGPFNGDANADLVVAARRASDDGVGVHIFNGGAEQFNNASTSIRDLPGPGWIWSQVKLAAGQFNSDPYADLALLPKYATDGVGIGVHVLYGNLVPFQDPTTLVRNLAGASGYSWDNVKLTAGPFNGDTYGDIAMFQLSGAHDTNVHLLFGGVGLAGMFTYDPTYWRQLAYNPYGWDWYLMKIV